MPIPKPHEDEGKDTFVERCMSVIGDEYDDNDQALAICYGAWDDGKSKQMLSAQLLEHAKSNTSGKGIFTASRYLSDVAGCLAGGVCPTNVMGLSDTNQWQSAIKQSAQTLTATDPDWVFDEKSFTTEKGYILVASGIMSTSKMDTDRDILEAKGAEIESVCPYLWHHIMVQPVGKVLGCTLSQVKSGDKDLDAVLFKTGILDVGNGLGRDTALLIEMGALRNSHGFEALEAKPIKGAGWHVTKYRTFEISGVTVPANTDAVFTEYSKEKSRFKNDLVKNWIKGHYDQRTKTFSGWSPETSENTPEETKSETVCSCQKSKDVKAMAPVKAEKFHLPGIPGSWETVQHSLRKSARDYIKDKMREECGCYYGYIESTFDDYVILCVYEDDGDCYYKVSWGLVDGKPSLIGDYVEVEIDFSATITEVSEEEEKSLDVPETKQVKTETVSTKEASVPSIVRIVDPVLASLGL